MQQSADASVRERAPDGISTHAMTGAWCVIVARNGERARTWYHHNEDDRRLVDALHRQADAWLETINLAETH